MDIASIFSRCCNLSAGVALNPQLTTNGMCEEQHPDISGVNKQQKNDLASGELYCCLLPQSGFPIATKWCCEQDVKVVPGATFTKRTCDRCGSLKKGGDVVATSPLALHWMRSSPRTECARRITPICTWREPLTIKMTKRKKGVG